MSAKRPRPAIPVLVHVDNPAEVGSVTVDTSTIEGKMDTVIANQNRIYDKIPTSSGGGSADLTTVNEKITDLAEAVGPLTSTHEIGNLLGRVKNISRSVGDYNVPLSLTDTDLRSLLYNVREAIGYSSTSPTTSGTSIRNKLATIDTNTTTVKNMIGTDNSVTADTSLIGATRNLVATVGKYGTQMDIDDTTIRGFLYNMRNAIGSVSNSPTTTGSTVRDLLFTLKGSIGPANSTAADSNLLGSVKNLIGSIGSSNGGIFLKDKTIRALLYNLREGIGNAENSPTATENTVRGLLTAIKENTASGGGGGGADLTTVNEKTTALAAAIGSASDDSSTVSVIGLLKSITDKY